jgi:hypothetical protein
MQSALWMLTISLHYVLFAAGVVLMSLQGATAH